MASSVSASGSSAAAGSPASPIAPVRPTRASPVARRKRILELKQAGQWIPAVSDGLLAQEFGCGTTVIRNDLTEMYRLVRQDMGSPENIRLSLVSDMYRVCQKAEFGLSDGKGGKLYDLKAALKGYAEIGRILGLYPSQKVDVAHHIEHLSDKELLDECKSLETELTALTGTEG